MKKYRRIFLIVRNRKNICKYGMSMEKQEIINKYKNDEDKLLVSKVLDKIKWARTKNKITNTDFLDMYQKKVIDEVLKAEKEKNFTYYYPCDNAEKPMLIIYSEKYDEILKNNKFDFSQFVKLIRIILPNQLKGQYAHRDYLSGIMKLGIRREKVGDILVFENGADIIVSSDICEYILANLGQLTRFSKAEIKEINLSEIRQPNIKTEEIRITVSAMRLDCVVAELAHCSRNMGIKIIEEQRVFLNYLNETKNSKEIKIDDILVIRGKGKFKIKNIEGVTKKRKIISIVEHYI